MNTAQHQRYLADCEQYYSARVIKDARRNWEHFQELEPRLRAALREFQNNQFQKDLAGRCHNASGSLTGFLWNLHTAWQADRSRLDPLLDFCDHYQKVFLRRGLVSYCKLLLAELDAGPPPDPNQPELALATGN